MARQQQVRWDADQHVGRSDAGTFRLVEKANGFKIEVELNLVESDPGARSDLERLAKETFTCQQHAATACQVISELLCGRCRVEQGRSAPRTAEPSRGDNGNGGPPPRRGPGRPRKTDEPKRKPGRPKKDQAKRGPGRPRKDEAGKAGKRGPGRPRKSEKEGKPPRKAPPRVTEAPAAAAPAASPKRGPGRPRKDGSPAQPRKPAPATTGKSTAAPQSDDAVDLVTQKMAEIGQNFDM